MQHILKESRDLFGKLPPIVIHCFTGKRAEAEAYIDAGFYIGITGFVVMEDRGRRLRGFIKDVVPLENLLLETDSPFMGFGDTDVRIKGFVKPNEPCTLPVIAATIAELYDVDVETVARITTKNASNSWF